MAISDFILARIAEEEQWAHDALDGRPLDHEWESHSDEDHFNCWTPWRVESACIVRRLLVRAHRNTGPVVIRTPDGRRQLVASTCQTCRLPDGQPAPWPCYSLRLLASEWAHHPDYRERWRPSRLDTRWQRSDSA